jgi:IstB-like ATP binding protein
MTQPRRGQHQGGFSIREATHSARSSSHIAQQPLQRVVRSQAAPVLPRKRVRRYERGATRVTSNLSFQEWTEVLGSERLTGTLLDRLTHHVHILGMNGASYRLKRSKYKRSR